MIQHEDRIQKARSIRPGRAVLGSSRTAAGRGIIKAGRMLAGMLLLLVMSMLLSGCGAKEISSNDLVKADFSGLNGEGTIRLTFDKARLEEIIGNGKPLTERQQESLDAKVRDAEKDYSISKKEGISNGEEIEIIGGFDKALLKDFNVVIKNDRLVVKADGLIEKKELSVNDFITTRYSGFEGNGRANFEIDWDAVNQAVRDRRLEIDPDTTDFYRDEDEVYNSISTLHFEPYEVNGLSTGDPVHTSLTMERTTLPSTGIVFTCTDIDEEAKDLTPIEEIRIADCLDPVFTGYDRLGQASVVLDRDKLVAAIEEAFEKDSRGAYGLLTEESDIRQEAENAADRVTSFWRSSFYTEVVPMEGLHDHDTVTIRTEYNGDNETALETSVGIIVTGGEFTAEATDLVPAVDVTVSDYIRLDYAGYDGAGTVTASFDTEALKKDLQKAFTDRGSEDAENEAASYADRISYRYSIELPQKNNLKNGDEVKAAVTLDTDSYPELGLFLESGEVKGEVTGLTAPKEIRLADALTVQFTGICPNVTVEREINYDLPYVSDSELYDMDSDFRIMAENGDTYSGTIKYDADALLQKGYVVTDAEFSYTVSGLDSYTYELEGAEDEKLASYIEEGQKRAENALYNYAGDVTNVSLNGRSAWVRWDKIKTAYEGATKAQLTNEDGTWNVLYLVYHSVVPVRLDDRTEDVKDIYYVTWANEVRMNSAGKLVTDNGWDERLWYTKEELDEAIRGHYINRLGEEAAVSQVTRDTASDLTVGPDVEPEEEQVIEEVDKAGSGPGSDGTGEAGDRQFEKTVQLNDIVPDYTDHSEIWEEVQDPYGNIYQRPLVFDTYNRGIREYQVNGAWDVFTGTISTWTDAGSESRMSMWIWGDNKLLYQLNCYQKADAPVPFTIDIEGVQRISIQTRCYTDNGGNYLFISNSAFAGKGEPVLDINKAAALYDLQQIDQSGFRSWYGTGMCADLYGNISRDHYEFNVWENGRAVYNLNKEYTGFSARLSLDSAPYNADSAASLEIRLDGEKAWSAENIRACDGEILVSLDLTGKRVMEICTYAEEEKGYNQLLAIRDTMLAAEKTEIPDTALPEEGYEEVSKSYERKATAEIVNGNFKYLLFDDPVSYAAAVQKAENAGASFAMPKNAAQNEAIRSLINMGQNNEYWMGGSLVRLGKGSWFYSDGEEFGEYQNWSSNQPDNYGEKEYLLTMYRDGTWNDLGPDEERGLVLQVPVTTGLRYDEDTRLSFLERTVENNTWIRAASCGDRYDSAAIYLNIRDEGHFETHLGGAYKTLIGTLVITDETQNNASGTLAVFGDGKLLYSISDLKRGDILPLEIDVSGVDRLSFMSMETGTDAYCEAAIVDAGFFLADKPECGKVVRMQDLAPVDQSETSRVDYLCMDNTGALHECVLTMNAGYRSYILYNLNGEYTELSFTVAAGNETRYDAASTIRVLLDNEEVYTLDDFGRLSEDALVTLDVTGRSTVRIETETEPEGNSWILIADAALK